MKDIAARLKKLPSHKKQHVVIKDDSIQKAIKKIQAIKAEDVIPAEFSLFDTQPVNENMASNF